MSGHDIIVIGTSAGGVDTLMEIVRDLPGDLPAALFVTMHIPPTGPSLLPEILTRAGPLPAHHPDNGERIEHGRIYIAPPDFHLLVRHNHIHLVKGPKENGFRPAIDASLRTAARTYGPRVVGVILTGMLDDGTAGLLAVKRRNGVAIVQDPSHAAFPSMPQSACRYVDVDVVAPTAEIAPLLVQYAHQPIKEGDQPMPDDLDLESDISGMDPEAISQSAAVGAASPFVCPECGGVLVEFYDGDLLRFRCQVGHAYSHESLFSQQLDGLDRALWAAFKSLDERAKLAHRLSADAHAFNDVPRERRFRQLAQQAEAQKEQIRKVLIKEQL